MPSPRSLKHSSPQTVQEKMYVLLSDGLPHSREALFECLYDDQAGPTAVRIALFRLRKILRPKGIDVLHEFVNGRMHYRMVRLLAAE